MRRMKRTRVKRWFRLTRRGFLKVAGGGALVIGAGAGIEALVVEPRWVRRTQPEIALEGLPRAWEGVRISLLTDIHLGPWVDLDHVAKAVAMSNDARPDIIALTGDFISRPRAVSPDFAAALKQLRASEGKFAVLGNHDYWHDPAGVTSMLRSAGITLLTNTRRTLERSGQRLCLAGVDDLWAGRPDLNAALDGADGQVPRVLLCHNPDYAERMPSAPRVDLMLCGHTHGGQVRLPLVGRPWLPIRNGKYAAGLTRGPHCRVYTSCGLGMVGLPIRLGCRPELPLITLRRA